MKKPTHPFQFISALLILPMLLVICDCSHKMDTSAEEEADPCSNAVGNGNEVISGPAGPEGGDFDQVFRSLEVDPVDPNTVMLGSERNGIIKTTDGGGTWRRLRQGMRHSAKAYPEVWDVADSPFNPSLVMAATADSPGPVAGDFPSSVACVYRSTDGGALWARSNCGLANSYALCIRFDPRDPSAAVLGIGGGRATFSAQLGRRFDGALMFSSDAGLNWSAASTPAGAAENVFWILRACLSGATHFVTFGFCPDDSSKNLGFLRSEDGGRTWNPFAASLRTRLIAEFDISIDGRVLYAVERDAFSMFTSIDGGLTWNTHSSPVNGPVRCSPSNSGVVLFCGGEKVYRSSNGLQSWDPVLTAVDRVDDLAFAPSKPNVVYLATKGYHIYKSNDAGMSWSHLTSLRAAGWLN